MNGPRATWFVPALISLVCLTPGSRRGGAYCASRSDDEPQPSRAWFILSQDDTNGLLHGLSQRLGKVIAPAKRVGAMWQGVDGRGRLELDVKVEGEAVGEIFVGQDGDRLKVCRNWHGARTDPKSERRPKSFVPEKGTDDTSYEFERVKK